MKLKKKLTRTIRHSVMDLLAQRDHSIKELRQKLKLKGYEPDQIQSAIDFVVENRWIGVPEELSMKFAESLHRKNKGIQYINRVLTEKGLPQIRSNSEIEVGKAIKLVHSKNIFSRVAVKDKKIKAKLARFLEGRGFTREIIRKVLFGLRVET